MSIAAGVDRDETFELDERLEEAAQRILTDQLPIPVRQRWQPLRIGMMNLFLFQDERFPFADGRLLLRGSNGTGKSRVLAMTLPLLLDGSFKATRVEPDRDPNRQVVWNLLMDDQSSATGYSWLEFGRIDEDGNDKFVTIGCGMRATRGQRIKPWFFVTDQRVDQSLELKAADDVPLTRQKLIEAIGKSGEVLDSATEYRRAVDEKLFRLGERYDPLIDLLLQLRQPKLAEKLDIVQLESALREALPPLPESLLDDAAEAFRDLDQYRSSLASDRDTLRNIQRFLKPYSDHVQRGVKRSLKTLTKANSSFESAQRELKNLDEKIENDSGEREKIENQRNDLEVEIKVGQSAIAELMKSPEMRSAQQLGEQQDAVTMLNERFVTDERSANVAEAEQKNAEQQVATVEREAIASFASLTDESAKCRTIAAPESLQNTHHEQMQTVLSQPTLESRDAFDKTKRKLLRESNRFQKSAEHLSGLNEQLSTLERELKSLRDKVQQAEQARYDANSKLDEADKHREQTRVELWDAILAWHEKATQTQRLLSHLSPLADWSDQWDVWNAESHHDDPSTRIVETARSNADSELIVEQQRLMQQQESLETEVTSLNDEKQRLESGEPILPPVRSHRKEQLDNESDIGIPFWKLVDFQPSIPQIERGNWEAALHDAGILDALLMPDGSLVGDNIKLAHLGMAALEEDRQLAQVLQPDEAANSRFTEPLIEILRVIGVGHDAGSSWVASDGSWRNGPVRGRLTKSDPQYIGKEARDRWREIRLNEIAAEIGSLKEQQNQIEATRQGIDSQRTEIENLVAQFPRNEKLLSTTQQSVAAQQAFDISVQQLTTANELEAAQQEKVAAQTKERDDDAADFMLSNWATRAAELRQRIEKYIASLETLEARVDTVVSANKQASNGRRAVSEANERLQTARNRLAAARTELEQARERVRVLQESAGKGVAEIMRQLETAKHAQTLRNAERDALSEVHQKLITSIAVAQSKLEERQSESKTSDEHRRLATDWFSDLHSHQLIEFVVTDVEIPELPWSMSAAIKLARQSDASLSSVSHDDESWLASQSRLLKAQTELQQTILSQDAMDVEVEPLRDGLQLVKLTVQGERLAPPAAAMRLEEKIATGERILDVREQDTLEKYLLGEVAEGLRKGMSMASDLVRDMTDEVQNRPMKTGMQMRFKWRRDDEGPTGLAEACQVLATDAATWSPDEREQIKQFLQRSIRQQRELESTGSWQEHMRAALDYRRWHRILIERRSGPDANWLKLTRRTYAGGSGGEKAIALTVPPLAAAAAYYRSADKLAPRFILLDEAFAGISSDGRESCMELIAAFGLDVVMTSESEWGMYAGVKQLSICQLDRFSDINAVVNRVYVWNGSQKRQMVSREEMAERESQPLLNHDVSDDVKHGEANDDKD